MNIKVIMIEIKRYQLNNGLIKLFRTSKMKNYLKKYVTWNVQLIIKINFMFSEDNDEEFVMHLKGDNLEMMINVKENEFIQ